jgi:hypothetical protein
MYDISDAAVGFLDRWRPNKLESIIRHYKENFKMDDIERQNIKRELKTAIASLVHLNKEMWGSDHSMSIEQKIKGRELIAETQHQIDLIIEIL